MLLPKGHILGVSQVAFCQYLDHRFVSPETGQQWVLAAKRNARIQHLDDHIYRGQKLSHFFLGFVHMPRIPLNRHYSVTTRVSLLKPTVCPARILQRLRVSTTPSTLTCPASITCLAKAPLAHKPSTLSKLFKVINSCPARENSSLINIPDVFIANEHCLLLFNHRLFWRAATAALPATTSTASKAPRLTNTPPPP